MKISPYLECMFRKEDTQDEFNVNAYTCIKFLWQTFHSLSLCLCNQELSFFVEIVYSNSLSLTSNWVKYTFRSRWFIHFVHCTQGSNEVFTVLCCFESSCAWTWFLSCVSCIFLNMLYIYIFWKSPINHFLFIYFLIYLPLNSKCVYWTVWEFLNDKKKSSLLHSKSCFTCFFDYHTKQSF